MARICIYKEGRERATNTLTLAGEGEREKKTQTYMKVTNPSSCNGGIHNKLAYLFTLPLVCVIAEQGSISVPVCGTGEGEREKEGGIKRKTTVRTVTSSVTLAKEPLMNE